MKCKCPICKIKLEQSFRSMYELNYDAVVLYCPKCSRRYKRIEFDQLMDELGRCYRVEEN